MKIVFSFDDGAQDDIKVARMLKRYGFKGVFFIPCNSELNEEEIKWLVDEGHEIGGHTVSHPQDMKKLSYEEQMAEIDQNADWLEIITDKRPKWFCYPRGKYNASTVMAVEESSYKYARTTLVGNYKKPTDNYRISTSVHIHPKRAEYNGETWLSFAYDMLDKASKEPNGVFHVWGHSWEINEFGIWDELEELLKRVYGLKRNKNIGSNNNSDKAKT